LHHWCGLFPSSQHAFVFAIFPPGAPVTEETKDKQLQFDLARGYKDHIDAVKLDRELEQWMQDAAHADKPCDENLTSVCNAILHLHILRVMGESWYSVKKIKHHQIYPFQSRLVPGTMPTAKQRCTTLHPCRF
jgi:hypothetical protein